MSEDLSWTLKSAAGLLPAAQQVLRVHGVAGRHGMLSLSQSAQVRIGALPAMRSDDPDYASNCALVAPCSAVATCVMFAGRQRALCSCKVP